MDSKKKNMLAEGYLETKKIAILPYVPLEGNIDLTYRCNNNCRHCWVRVSPDSPEKNKELSLEQIRKIAEDAKALGCRRWAISGGEPMLRPDFLDIFDYLTRPSNSYSINTNGTFITPKIAKFMKRKGAKMIALYGATREVHDHITRNPGSFDAVMRGFRYLKEAGAGFIVQVVPMRDNYHQFEDMLTLAESLSRHFRVGAAWLYLSACGDPDRNAEIVRQRLTPREVVEIDQPDVSYEDEMKRKLNSGCFSLVKGNGHLFSSCIKTRHDFHIDAYGQMTFCCFIRDPQLRYDLAKGNLREGWEDFIPSLSTRVKISKEYRKGCGSCSLRNECRICPVYSYLEHRNFSSKVDYLCSIARENRKIKNKWRRFHRRYYRIAEMTLQVESDLPIREDTFHPDFKHFEESGPAEDVILIRHHFSLPDFRGQDLGRKIYEKSPWAIYKNDDSWIYLGISSKKKHKDFHRVVIFNQDHTRANIYNENDKVFLKGGNHSLTLFPSDQVLLAQILADRGGCYLHSCGVNFEGKGLLFAGRSGAGKSTMATLLTGKAEILCDDRMILRKQQPDRRKPNARARIPQTGFRIYGTWSHGDVPLVSGNSAPLEAIIFLDKADENILIPLRDEKEATRRLLACLIKPLATLDWWEKELSLIEEIVGKVPCYMLKFDKSDKVVNALRGL